MSRTAYLDCVGGIAGDMLLAALLDAGAEPARLRAVPDLLDIGPVEIRVTRVERHGIGALHVEVVEPEAPPPRTWRAMRDALERAELPERARGRALRTLARLAEAEAAVHGTPVDDVHFHEIGGVDTLVDVGGAALHHEDLAVDEILRSPLP